jgi:hypothetical protein
MRLPRPSLVGSLLLGLLLMGASGDTATTFTVADGSRFWIEGTSTVSPYTCATERPEGRGRLGSEAVSASVTVNVRAFDCGVRAMNRDFYRALQAEQHPDIRFTLTHAEVLEQPASEGDWAPVRAFGRLELAGTSRSVTILAEGRRLDGGRAQIRGNHAMRMTHFGIDPPAGMLGLVRAHDQIVVGFDLIATASRR